MRMTITKRMHPRRRRVFATASSLTCAPYVQTLVREQSEANGIALVKHLNGIGGEAGRGLHMQLLLTGITHALQPRPPAASPPTDASAGDSAVGDGEGWLQKDIAAMVLAALLPVSHGAASSGQSMTREDAEQLIMARNAAAAALSIHRFLLIRHRGVMPLHFAQTGAPGTCAGGNAALMELYASVGSRVACAVEVLNAAGGEHASSALSLGLLALAAESAQAALPEHGPPA